MNSFPFQPALIRRVGQGRGVVVYRTLGSTIKRYASIQHCSLHVYAINIHTVHPPTPTTHTTASYLRIDDDPLQHHASCRCGVHVGVTIDQCANESSVGGQELRMASPCSNDCCLCFDSLPGRRGLWLRVGRQFHSNLHFSFRPLSFLGKAKKKRKEGKKKESFPCVEPPEVAL